MASKAPRENIDESKLTVTKPKSKAVGLPAVTNALKIDTMIDGFVCADEITHPKPDPEPYLKAAALLGLEPRACVAVEDSQPGVTSALAAGMSVIMVNPAPASTTVPSGVVVVRDHHQAEGVLFEDIASASDDNE